MKADAELGTFKIRHYHFDDESFVHPLHSVRFDADRSYKILIEALMADKILSSSNDEKSSTERSRSFRRPMPHYSPRGMPSTQPVLALSVMGWLVLSSSLRKPRSWELISPSEGWMCDCDDEKEIGGMEPSIINEVSSEEEDPEEQEDPKEEEEESKEEEDPEERIPTSSSLPMDIDAEEDYLRYIDELERPPEYSLLHSSQASVPDVPVETSDRLSDGHNASSYDLSGVWKTPSSGSSP
ncbi:hypothetical protein PIB30_014358 [Stylosanthes scabra]|uniref:Uncharacterized protein n=1 Tax=Stylosanthes scabra TaxID=79078 RepID=A0ABU6S6I9_9FABA|nr:hypothetical protein [Stylosanthes scabra]